MPQRVNAKSDIGNSKLASDVYDTNNIFLTDQGWVYRHWKGDPTVPTTRYWDEILVAGQVNPDYPEGSDSSPIQPTIYLDRDGNETDRSQDPFYYLSTGNQKYPETLTKAGYEPNQALEGDPDKSFDVEYSKHTEVQPDGTVREFGDPTKYDFDALRDEDGNVLPPPLPQFPEVVGYETPGFTGTYPVNVNAPADSTPPPSAATPQAINGYYPLYTSEGDANAAGDGSSHTHEFDGTTYYMPNGVTFYHGDYSG